MTELQEVFCIDIFAYAVMSNHYHLVLCIDEESATELNTDEVIERWCLLFKDPLLIQRYRDGVRLSEAEYKVLSEIAEQWCIRLTDISWFMRCLNEYIARKANQEDSCKGHFWESRFKSQALLDEKALLTCMAYVDLNPIRAAIAQTPETSDYTSVQARINSETEPSAIAVPILKPFNPAQHNGNSIGYSLQDYLELVDYSGRAIRNDKRGYIAHPTPPILLRLGIDADAWQAAMAPKGIHIASVLGDTEHIEDYTKAHHLRCIVGAGRLKNLLH